jgi:SAM-dependent methyltransferase
MVDMMQPAGASYKVQRRVAGVNELRLDGMGDLLLRAKGKSVFDIGCNRGMVGYQFAQQGAAMVHGCDIYEKGIETAREVFADLRFVEGRFEVVDLTEGPEGARRLQLARLRHRAVPRHLSQAQARDAAGRAHRADAVLRPLDPEVFRLARHLRQAGGE